MTKILHSKASQPILYAILIAAGMFLGKFADRGTSSKSADTSKVNQVLKLVHNQYVDTLDSDKLQESVIRGVLSSLDPHSVYIPSDEVEQANRDLVGSFVGIGIEFNVLNDTPYIVRVMADGPAYKAGIRPADRMIKADTSSLLNLENKEVIKVLKGEMGSAVNLYVKRPGQAGLSNFKIKRNTVPIPSIPAVIKVANGVGYIRIDRFADKTAEEFKEGLQKLQQEYAADQLIIDLRNNPGGYLHVAIDMLDQFFDDKKILAYTKGKTSYKKEYYSKAGGVATEAKVICLVNRYSASASEIFSGALQDYDRGLVVGEKTFGKGLVQETFQLPDKSQLRLTVSRYYIPSGRCIQKSYSDGIQSYYDEIIHRKDTQFGETDSFYFETTGGRKVFGGGGIDPDVVIHVNGAREKWMIRKSFNQKLIDLIDQQYDLITESPDQSMLLESTFPQAAQNMIDQDTGVEVNDFLLPVIRRFYGDEAYYKYLISSDSLIQSSKKYFRQYQEIMFDEQ